MAKIGTAHIEIKPVIDESALKVITDRITEAVAAGVQRGMQPREMKLEFGQIFAADPNRASTYNEYLDDWTPCEHKPQRGSCRECRAL